MSGKSTAMTWLAAALLDARPACADDDRFTDDDTNPADLEHLCHLCPLYDACLDYARTARPAGGIWAGRRWASGKYTTNR